MIHEFADQVVQETVVGLEDTAIARDDCGRDVPERLGHVKPEKPMAHAVEAPQPDAQDSRLAYLESRLRLSESIQVSQYCPDQIVPERRLHLRSIFTVNRLHAGQQSSQ